MVFAGGDRSEWASVLHEAAYVRLAVGGCHMKNIASCRDVAHVKDGFRLRPRCHKPTEHHSARQIIHLYVTHFLRCRDRQGVACGIGMEPQPRRLDKNGRVAPLENSLCNC